MRLTTRSCRLGGTISARMKRWRLSGSTAGCAIGLPAFGDGPALCRKRSRWSTPPSHCLPPTTSIEQRQNSPCHCLLNTLNPRRAERPDDAEPLRFSFRSAPLPQVRLGHHQPEHADKARDGWMVRQCGAGPCRGAWRVAGMLPNTVGHWHGPWTEAASGTRCSSVPPVRFPRPCRRTSLGRGRACGTSPRPASNDSPAAMSQAGHRRRGTRLSGFSAPPTPRTPGDAAASLFAAPLCHWVLTSIATMPPTGRVSSRA